MLTVFITFHSGDPLWDNLRIRSSHKWYPPPERMREAAKKVAARDPLARGFSIEVVENENDMALRRISNVDTVGAGSAAGRTAASLPATKTASALASASARK